jgi:exonuclease VII large subunit
MTELAASTPTERAETMVRLTQRLTQLLDRETELFKARRPKEAIVFQDEKSKLASIYRLETEAVSKDRSRLAGIDAALKNRLKTATQTFETALKRNGIASEALKTLTEGVAKVIIQEATRQQNAKAGYGPGASQTARLGAMAVNQTA